MLRPPCGYCGLNAHKIFTETIGEIKDGQGSLSLSGLSPDGCIVEMCELKDHPFFIATQGHPELKSRPNRPHPLFRGFVAAALEDSLQ